MTFDPIEPTQRQAPATLDDQFDEMEPTHGKLINKSWPI